MAAAVITGLLTMVVWGGPQAPAVWHDEAAYLLQARIFADGRWVAPSPPLPEFFEQYHVLVVPALAAKYPPGHSLVLAPFASVGAASLGSLVLAACLAGGMLLLVSKYWSTAVAIGAWMLWLVSPLAVRFRSSYLSELTTAALWVGVLWTLGRIRERPTVGHLCLVSLLLSWMMITRPLTGVLVGIPVAIVLLRWRRAIPRRALLTAGLCAFGVAGIVPLWSHATTGRWTITPLQLYTSQYMPWDRMGFGLDGTAATRAGPPDMAEFAEEFRRLHASFTPSSAARLAAKRLAVLWRDAWGDAMWVATVLGLAGLYRARRGLALVGAQASLVIAGYALYAHPVEWNVYYYELLPLLCLLPVLGLHYVADVLASTRRKQATLWMGLGVILILMLPASLQEVSHVRTRARPHREFRTAAAGISGPALVFVRRAATHSPHVQLVENAANLTFSRILIAHDRGAADSVLAKVFVDHRPYRYDEATAAVCTLYHADAKREMSVGAPGDNIPLCPVISGGISESDTGSGAHKPEISQR